MMISSEESSTKVVGGGDGNTLKPCQKSGDFLKVVAVAWRFADAPN